MNICYTLTWKHNVCYSLGLTILLKGEIPVKIMIYITVKLPLCYSAVTTFGWFIIIIIIIIIIVIIIIIIIIIICVA